MKCLGKLWKNLSFYRENSHQLQTEFCLNVATRIWSKEDESCLQMNCIAAVRPRVAFSNPVTDAAAAQQDAKTHGSPTYVTDHAKTSAVIIVLLMGM